MGREVRRVPADWKHPKDVDGNPVPLLEGYSEDVTKFASDPDVFDAEAPCRERYMPEWPKEERTHYQMYENTSEGTPVSPPMETPESLARWLADNKASAWAGKPASYEAWLATIRKGYAMSAMSFPGEHFRTGVEANRVLEEEGKDGEA